MASTSRVVKLLLSTVINGFAVSVYVKSRMGVSTISSIPLVFSELIPALSLGMTTILFQALLLAILILLMGFQKRYAVSFALGCFFGSVVDIWNQLWTVIPIAVLPRIVLFGIGFVSLSFGIALALSCNLTALPFDIFTKDIAAKCNKTIKFVKTIFDITCVTLAIVLSLACTGQIRGVGIGTILSMFFTGTMVHFFHSNLTTNE